MPLPGDLNLITVAGSYADPATGAPLDGLVTFYLAQPLTDTVGNVTLAAGPYSAAVVGGAFSITLPCTDNASLNPTNFAYQVTEQVPGVYRSNTYQLPHTLGAAVNIAQLVPVNPSPPYSTVYGVLANTQTWTGVNTFTQPVGVGTPVGSGDAATKAYVDGHGSGSPSGPAGGVLSGTYPNPGANPGTPGNSAVGDVASAGSAATLALSDHRHGREAYGTPGSSAVGDTASAGVATTDARSDHRHGRESFGTVSAQTAFGLGSSSGAAVTPARSDHAHGTPSLIDADARKLGLVGEPFPPEALNHADLGASSGFLILALIRPGAGTITNLGLFLGTAGSGSTGVNAMALFDENGNQLGITGDMTAALSNAANNGTYVEAALTATVTTADATNYYVGLLCHMSSNPLIAGIFNGSGLALPTVKGHRPQIELSGQATMPASFSVAGAIAAPAAYWLVAS